MNTLSQTELKNLEKLEEELWQGETRFNENYMRKVMANDFFEFGRSGRVYDLEEVLSISSEKIEAEIPLPNLQIRQLSTDVVQITYDSAVGHLGNIQYARRSSIWSRNGETWQLRFHQGTPYTPSI